VLCQITLQKAAWNIELESALIRIQAFDSIYCNGQFTKGWRRIVRPIFAGIPDCSARRGPSSDFTQS